MDPGALMPARGSELASGVDACGGPERELGVLGGNRDDMSTGSGEAAAPLFAQQ